MAAFLLAWAWFLRWCRVTWAARVTLRDGYLEVGQTWPLRVTYDQITSLQVSDALGSLAAPGRPPPGGTVHIRWAGLRMRLTLGLEGAQACADALATACPNAVLIDPHGAARAADGRWSPAHRDAARAFYSGQLRLLGFMTMFGLGCGALGAIAVSRSGSRGLDGVALFFGIGIHSLVGYVRVWRLARALPAVLP